MSGGFGSDGDAAALAELVSESIDIDAAERAAQVRRVRMLARAGTLAERQSVGATERVKVHDMALRSIAAELAGVSRMTDRAVQRRIDEACDLVENYSASLAAWEKGRITRRHVDVIREAGTGLPDEVHAEFEDQAIARCATDTPNRVRDAVQIIAERLHSRTLTERHRQAAVKRCVRVEPGRDGMSDLVATLPTVLAVAIHDRLTQQARAIVRARPGIEVATATDADAATEADAGTDSAAGVLNAVTEDASSFADDTRSIDEVRADVFTDLALAGTPSLDPTAHGDGEGDLGAIRARMQVVVSALTLMGSDDEPADLVGTSPIDAATARRLAGDAPTWDRILTHPVTGTVLECDAYAPTAAQRRLLRARDRRCRFPGCRQPAFRCELDHTVARVEDGPTHVGNLAHLCKRHHDTKHHTRWTVRQIAGGTLVWTSPTGRVYREDAPPPLVVFTVDAGPPDPPPF